MSVRVLRQKADELIERTKVNQSMMLRKLTKKKMKTLFGVAWSVFVPCMIYVIFPFL